MFACQPHVVVVRLCVRLTVRVCGSKRDGDMEYSLSYSHFQNQMTSLTSNPPFYIDAIETK